MRGPARSMNEIHDILNRQPCACCGRAFSIRKLITIASWTGSMIRVCQECRPRMSNWWEWPRQRQWHGGPS